MAKKAFGLAAFCIVVLALVISCAWHERHRWTFYATVASGVTTSVLGFMNANGVALGVILTLFFGILNHRAKQRIVRAAESGKLRLEEVAGDE